MDLNKLAYYVRDLAAGRHYDFNTAGLDNQWISSRVASSMKPCESDDIAKAPDQQVHIYTNLRLHPETQTRIVTLLPAPSKEAGIVCSLEVRSLQQCGQYEALSYTWGPAWDGQICRPQTIFVNGWPFEVTQNLHDALCTLRLEDARRSLWVDQICINQNDQAEQAAQIAIMGGLFERAERVIAWLGKDSREREGEAMFKIYSCWPKYDLDAWASPLNCNQGLYEWYGVEGQLAQHDDREGLTRIMSELSVLCREYLVDGSRPDVGELLRADWEDSVFPELRDWVPVLTTIAFLSTKLLERRFFFRRWIVQEIYLARKVLFVCGSHSLDLSDFLQGAVATMWMFYIPVLKPFHPIRTKTPKSKALRLIQNASTVCDPRHQYPVEFEGGKFLQDMVDLSRYSCSDPRDRIFALRSLYVDRWPALDYTEDYVALYTSLARKLVAETTGISSLLQLAAAQAGNPNRHPDLPSWVPDWRLKFRLPFKLRQSTILGAASMPDDRALGIRAICLGVADAAGKFGATTRSALQGTTETNNSEWDDAACTQVCSFERSIQPGPKMPVGAILCKLYNWPSHSSGKVTSVVALVLSRSGGDSKRHQVAGQCIAHLDPSCPAHKQEIEFSIE